MELKLLRRFLAVVERGSLTAAAPELGLTQQALGASIARLEEEVGVTLLDRGPGGATSVTPYGSMLIGHAKGLIAMEERARESLRAFRDAQGGSVALGIGEAFSTEVIAEAVHAFHAARPGVRMTMIEGYSEVLLARLSDGEIDFIAGADLTGSADAFVHFPIYKARDIVIARPDHALAGRRDLSLSELAPYTWLVPHARPQDAATIVETFRNADAQPPSRFIWTDAPVVGMNLLQRDDYLLMTSPALVTRALEDGRVVALDIAAPTVERRAGLIYRAETRLNPSAMRLMEDIRAIAHRQIDRMSYASPLNDGQTVADWAERNAVTAPTRRSP